MALKLWSSAAAFASAFGFIPIASSAVAFASSFLVSGGNQHPSTTVLFASSFTSTIPGGAIASLRYRR